MIRPEHMVERHIHRALTGDNVRPSFFTPCKNRAPFVCTLCGESHAWNQKRTGRDRLGNRIDICRNCNGR